MIVLDTHAWLFWVDENEKALSKKAAAAIAQAEVLGVCAISCWEVAMLVSKKRLAFHIDVEDWIAQALQYPKVHLLNLEPSISVLSTRLPGKFHGDPADRIIVATCLKYDVPLVTKDRMIRRWKKIATLW